MEQTARTQYRPDATGLILMDSSGQ